MSKVMDGVTKQFVKQNEVFVDVINYALYDGDSYIEPDSLQELDSSEIVAISKDDVVDVGSKIRDALKKAVIKRSEDLVFMILGIENQTDICYDMIIRCQLYNDMQYDAQANQISKANNEEAAEWKKAEDKRKEDAKKALELNPAQEEPSGANASGVAGGLLEAESLPAPPIGKIETSYASRLRKGQKLIPVITVVVYYGPKKWDAPVTLKEILHIGKIGKAIRFIPDVEMPLISISEIDEPDVGKFQSDMRKVVKTAKNRGNIKALRNMFKTDPDFKVIDPNTALVIKELTAVKFDVKEGESMNMAISTQDWEEDIKAELIPKLTEEITEKVTEEITEKLTEEITEKLTEEITEKLTEEITEKVTEEVTEKVTVKVTNDLKFNQISKFISIGITDVDTIVKITELDEGTVRSEVERLTKSA